MREHMGLFHGKRIDTGEWVEGFFIVGTDCVFPGRAFICERIYVAFDDDDELTLGGFIEVDPDTISECTSRKDKNGKLIFEGDIVRCGTGRICKVTFFTSPGVSGFDLVAIGGIDAPPPHNWVLFADTEIIGNIYDNKHLLSGQEVEE